MQVEDGAARVLSPGNLLTSLTGRNLVIQRGVLVDSGHFTFRLYASSDASELANLDTCVYCGFAEVTIMRNLPPASGRLVASPERGYAQDTLFTLSAESWVDPPIPQDDYPLTYSFGYYHLSLLSLPNPWSLC